MKAVTAKPQQYAYDKSLVTGLTKKIIQMFIPVIMIIRLLVYRTKRFRKPNGFLANRMPGSSVKSHLKQSRKSSQTKQLRKHFLQLHQATISGDYILTGLDCNIDANARVSMGESGHDTFIVDLLSPEKIPVAGANYIHIEKNELVDAGILDIRHQTSHSFLFSSNSGTAEGSLTSARFQDYLNNHFPDLAKKIKFTHFEAEKSLISAPQENSGKK